MNVEQAKQLDFPKLLSKLGFEPVRVLKMAQSFGMPHRFDQKKNLLFIHRF